MRGVFFQPEREGLVDPLEQSVVIGLAFFAGREEIFDLLRHHFIDYFVDHGPRVVGFDRLVAVSVNHAALLVHHVVEFERALADEVIALLDALLCGLHTLVEPRMLEFLTLLHPEALHDLGHPIGRAEVAHEVVLEADKKLRTARVALTRATSAQLPVDTPRFVALGADDVEPAGALHPGAEFDVRAAARHVGRNGHGARLAGPGHNLGFLEVEFRVEDIVRDFFPFEHAAEQFGRLDAGRANQNRLLPGVPLFDLFDDRVVFLAPRLVDAVVRILAGHIAVGRDDNDIEGVNVVKFIGLRFGRAGHAAEFLVEAEIILDGNGGQGLGLAVDLHPFLRLDRLMQAVAPTAPRHFPAGELVDDENFVFLDDIFHVLFVKAVGLEQLGDIVDALGLRVIVLLLLRFAFDLLLVGERGIEVEVGELVDQVGQDEGVRIVRVHERTPLLGEVRFVLALFDRVEEFLFERDERLFVGVLVERKFRFVDQLAHLGLLHEPQESFVAGLAEFDFEKREPGRLGVTFFEELLDLGDEAGAKHGLLADQLVDERLETLVLVGRNGGRAADDQRSAGFVNEDGIHFVDDGEEMTALDLLFLRRGHAIVPQVVEAELAIGPVSDVAGVLSAAQFRGLVVLDDPDGQAEEAVNFTDPLGIAAREVIVHRDEVGSSAGQGVEVKRQGGDERFAFAGGHFSDAPAMQDHAADELHVEVDHLPFDGVADHIDMASTEAAGRVFHHGKGLGQDLVEGFLLLLVVLDRGDPRLPLGGHAAEFLVRERLVLLFEGVDLAHDGHHALDLALIFRADDFLDDEIDHVCVRAGAGEPANYPSGPRPQRKLGSADLPAMPDGLALFPDENVFSGRLAGGLACLGWRPGHQSGTPTRPDGGPGRDDQSFPGRLLAGRL